MNYTERQNFNVWQSVVKTSFITALSCYYLQVASGNHIKVPRSTAAVKKWSIGVNEDDGTLSLPRGLKTNQAKWYLPIRHRAGRVIILPSCKKEHPQKRSQNIPPQTAGFCSSHNVVRREVETHRDHYCASCK